MMTQHEIEGTVCDCLRCFELECMGRAPKGVRAHLLDDLVVVRLEGVLTEAEQHLVKSLPGGKGRDLLKQVRCHLVEVARPAIDAMIKGVTGVSVVSLHHDVSTQTGEEIIVLTLDHSPFLKPAKNSNSNGLRHSGAAHRGECRSSARVPSRSVAFPITGVGTGDPARDRP